MPALAAVPHGRRTDAEHFAYLQVLIALQHMQLCTCLSGDTRHACLYPLVTMPLSYNPCLFGDTRHACLHRDTRALLSPSRPTLTLFVSTRELFLGVQVQMY